jgi:AbrB family looped-hinge helix DNA binding protein
MTYKVGPKGQVVLPKAIRARLGIEPGDEVLVEQEGDEIRIRRVADVRAVRGILFEPNDSLTDVVEADHRWEIAHDEMRQAKRDQGDGRS